MRRGVAVDGSRLKHNAVSVFRRAEPVVLDDIKQHLKQTVPSVGLVSWRNEGARAEYALSQLSAHELKWFTQAFQLGNVSTKTVVEAIYNEVVSLRRGLAETVMTQARYFKTRGWSQNDQLEALVLVPDERSCEAMQAERQAIWQTLGQLAVGSESWTPALKVPHVTLGLVKPSASHHTVQRLLENTQSLLPLPVRLGKAVIHTRR